MFGFFRNDESYIKEKITGAANLTSNSLIRVLSWPSKFICLTGIYAVIEIKAVSVTPNMAT